MHRVLGRTGLIVATVILPLFMIAPCNIMAQQETPPPPAPPRPLVLPEPSEKTLTNGLRVIVVQRHNVPLVTAELVIKSGGEVDPPQLAGLSYLTAELLTEGTTTRTAPQIASEIEALGGSISSTGRWDVSTASIEVMSSKISPAMAILADVVQNASFKQDELERQRKQILDSLEVSLHQPGQLARFVATRVVFGSAPYGHLLSGTPESLGRITRDDLVRLHQTYYRPDNAVLVIGGDITPAAAFDLADRFFGKWARPATPLPTGSASAGASQALSAASTPGVPAVLVIDKPDAGQAAVILARTGLERKDPDYFRGLVANSVLGGGYSARLNEEIRIKRGLSYGASSSLDVRRMPGLFIAATQTRNETAAEVATLLRNEFMRLANEPVQNSELVPRKAVLIGSFGRRLETNSGIVSQVATLAAYGLSLDEIKNYVSNVQAVTAAGVQEFAGAHLKPSGATIIIVGNAQKFLDKLRHDFPGVEVIPEAQLDLNSANLRKGT